MSRRDSGETDSLELLLDTICNMFGGVLFIAMLLAILAGAKGAGIAKSAGITSIAEASELRSTLTQLEHEVPALEAAASLINNAVPTASLNLGELSTRLAEDTRAAQERLQQARRTLEALETRDADFDSQLSAAAQTAKQLQRANDGLRESLARERSSKIADARLPVTRRTEKLPLHLIIKNGRIYEVYSFDPEHGVSVNRADVTSSEAGMNVEITPRADAGFPPTSNLSRHPRWRSIVAHRPAGRYFLYLMVYPDSFDVFRDLRVESMRAGYEYDLVIMPEASRVILTPADDFTTQ